MMQALLFRRLVFFGFALGVFPDAKVLRCNWKGLGASLSVDLGQSALGDG
jgi:hypothetical protein